MYIPFTVYQNTKGLILSWHIWLTETCNRYWTYYVLHNLYGHAEQDNPLELQHDAFKTSEREKKY